jgi:TetR/AcrR family transcriptional repressor of bet genes
MKPDKAPRPLRARPDPDTPAREVQRAARRQQLIEGAIQAVARHGYAATTIAQIAAEAGLSHGLVGYHFNSKDELLSAVMAWLAEELDASIRLAQSAPPGERLAALLQAPLQDHICQPAKLAVWFSFWGEAQARGSFRSVSVALEDRYQAILADSLALQMPAASAGPRAALLSAVIDGLWLDMHLGRDGLTPAGARARILSDLALLAPPH